MIYLTSRKLWTFHHLLYKLLYLPFDFFIGCRADGKKQNLKNLMKLFPFFVYSCICLLFVAIHKPEHVSSRFIIFNSISILIKSFYSFSFQHILFFYRFPFAFLTIFFCLILYFRVMRNIPLAILQYWNFMLQLYRARFFLFVWILASAKACFTHNNYVYNAMFATVCSVSNRQHVYSIFPSLGFISSNQFNERFLSRCAK